MKTRLTSGFTLILVLLFNLLASPTTALAYLGDSFFLPPHANYQELETAHFKIVFPGEYEVEASQTASFFEQAHKELSAFYDYEPGHRVTVILADNEDFANGVTSAVGLQGMILFLTAPDPYSSIGEYEHWLKNLIVHEYAHYLTLEQTRGIFELGRYVFGNLLFPNHAWPAFIAEGIAVQAETKFTRGGRGYGTYYSTLTRDGLQRGILGTKQFLDYESLSGPVPHHPFGEAWYYAGYAMVDQMSHWHGEKAAGRFAEASSWRIPFFLDGTLENINHSRSSHGWEDLWQAWVARQREHMKLELDWLTKHGAPSPETLTPDGVRTLGTRLSPDGRKAAFVLQSGHERPSVQVVDTRTKEIRKIDDAISGAGLAWSPDGRKLYYAKTNFDGPFRFYSDLFVHDFGGGTDRLTEGERAKDPDLCHTQAALVYGRRQGRFSEIRVLDLKSGKIRTLHRAPEHHHVSTPRCSRDGKRVYFTHHGTQPGYAIQSISFSGGDLRQEIGGADAGFGAMFPEPLTNGDVYFTRVKDGYYELARWSARTRKTTPLARSSGGYWMPSYEAGKLAVSYVTSTGIRAALVDTRKLNVNANASSGIEKAPVVGPATRYARPAPAAVTRVDGQLSGYNFLTSLAPRFWSPFLLISDDQQQFGASVTGWDDIDQFEYLLTGWYDSVSKSAQGVAGTFHRLGSFRLSLQASSEVSDFLTLANGRRIFNEERKLGALFTRPFPGAFANFTPGVVAEWARTSRGGDLGSFAFRPELRLGAELLFDNRQRFAYSIAPERGSAVRLAGRRFFSRDLRAWKALLSWQQLFAVVPEHSSLSFTAHAAWAPSPLAQLPATAVRVGGSGDSGDLDPPLRGYPRGSFYSKRAGVLQSEFRLPLAQVFTGFGNWPVFLRNLGVFGFYDVAKYQSVVTSEYQPLLQSAGGGLLLNTALAYNLPVQFRLEFAHGFDRDRNGQDTFALTLGL